MALVDASGYGEDSPRACFDLLNAERVRQGVAPLSDPAPDTHTSTTRFVQAYVNHGRWVVDCPCGSAQLAARTDPRLWCHECRNAWAGGSWVPVIWPGSEDDIEGLLLQRPDLKTRNWNPTEDVMTLVAENVAAGLGA